MPRSRSRTPASTTSLRRGGRQREGVARVRGRRLRGRLRRGDRRRDRSDRLASDGGRAVLDVARGQCTPPNYRCLAQVGYSDDSRLAPILVDAPGRAAAAHFDRRPQDAVPHRRGRRPADLPDDERSPTFKAAAIAPLHAGFGVRGWISVRAPEGDLGHFTDERLRLLEGLSYRASVALQKSVLLQSEQASAEVASALLEFSRRLAGVSGHGRAAPADRRADRRDARLAPHLALARARPARVVRDRRRVAGRRRRPDRPDRQRGRVRRHTPRARARRALRARARAR